MRAQATDGDGGLGQLSVTLQGARPVPGCGLGLPASSRSSKSDSDGRYDGPLAERSHGDRPSLKAAVAAGLRRTTDGDGR